MPAGLRPLLAAAILRPLPAKSIELPLTASNIRLLRFDAPHACEAIRVYHRAQEDLWRWNHEFWLENNLRFEAMREVHEADLRLRQPHLFSPAADPTLLDAHMAIFYRRYLTEHAHIFQAYHRTWWRRNVRLLGLAARAALARFWRRHA